jgi:MFS family permease
MATWYAQRLPGLLVAALVRTIREPARRETRSAAGAPIGAVLAYIKEHRATFACHHLATALISFAAYSYGAWVPSSLVRTYGWSIGRAGLAYGSVVTLFSTLGILAGGWCCDFLARRGYRDAHVRVGLSVSLLILPLVVLLPLMPTAERAIALLIPTCVLSSSMFGVAPAALQQVVPNEMRAQVSAMYLFVVNIVGLGAGPTVVALLTDRVFHDDNMLRYSLMITCTSGYLLSALLWRLGLGPFRRTVEQAEALRS